MGAAAILRAVHAHAIQPDGVILEAVFDTLLNTVRHRFRAMQVPAFPSAELLVFWGGRQWGFDGFEHNPSGYAASVHCPTLLMHGARLVFSCGWHITRDGQDLYSRRFKWSVAALENDEPVHEAPAIVGCQTPSALAHAAE
jgi:hypothetical protein